MVLVVFKRLDIEGQIILSDSKQGFLCNNADSRRDIVSVNASVHYTKAMRRYKIIACRWTRAS